MTAIRDLLGPMRLPFLILAPACAVLGVGTAAWRSGELDPLYVALVFLGAITAHVSVNALNEYFDFKSGLDARTERTPFSGGSGTLPANPSLAGHALRVGLGAMTITALIGLYFLSRQGLALLPLGLLGLLVIFAYTPWLAHNAFFCLIAPGLGFGTLMVMGADFVLAGDYSWTAFFGSLVPFFLVNNLLLLNQFPDMEADRSIGRKNIPIIWGKKRAAIVYGAFLLCTYLSIVLGVALGHLPGIALLGLLSLLLAVPLGVGAYRYAESREGLMPYLGMNVMVNILTPVLVAIGMFIG
jgi:1,4-dihydroxy-2-naphthoate octaprenyltransferase